jgi:hypothetical protein
LKVFDFLDLSNPVEIFWTVQSHQLLPDNSLILFNFAKHAGVKLAPVAGDNFNPALLLQGLKLLPVNVDYVFIDDSYDPITLSDLRIQETVELVTQHFTNSHVIFLSSKCSHYHSNEKHILWYPFFLLTKYPTVIQPRQHRIGCLNRRNALHRIWLMHNLLSQNLIDHDRDIFSIAFANVYDHRLDNRIDAWLGLGNTNYNTLIAQYPDSIATIPDNFPNDHGILHPAWHTAITIVTETECDELGIITEKTAKALAAKCCWIAYTGSDCIRVLTNLGFETQLFDQHATGRNIDPIVQVCRDLDTESAAMDYYHSKLPQIEHNKQHLDHGWLTQYAPKLKQALGLL